MKECRTCKQSLEDDKFRVIKSNGKLCGACKTCESEYKKAWHWRNRDHIQAKKVEYQKEHHEEILARAKRYRTENRELINEKKREYRKINAAKVANDNRARAARKVHATPSWANREAIEKFYETSQGLSMLLGEWYHVDHIVPLTSDFVCGLHCEANLQVVPAVENLTKNNRWWPDMWEPVPLEEITNGF
jgi:arsenate reductase-like glutaredoxin family protein